MITSADKARISLMAAVIRSTAHPEVAVPVNGGTGTITSSRVLSPETCVIHRLHTLSSNLLNSTVGLLFGLEHALLAPGTGALPAADNIPLRESWGHTSDSEEERKWPFGTST